MTLTLTYKAETSVPVEIEGLTPTWAREKSLSEIGHFEIYHGNQKLPLAEMFDLERSADDLRFDFQGDLSGVHWTGADMLDVDYKTDLNVCHEAIGDRAVVRGTLDSSSVLRFGTVEQVDELSRQNIETFTANGGKFFLNAGCDIMAGTPPENIRAMVDAAHKYNPFRD